MPLILYDNVIPAVAAVNKKRGGIEFEITGKKLEIKHGDEKLFEERPPDGKKWKVSVILDITETDA